MRGIPQVDAVYIGLPTRLHYTWTKKCAAAGKHVLVEKPMTLNAVEVNDVTAVAKQHGVVVLEAYHYRYPS